MKTKQKLSIRDFIFGGGLPNYLLLFYPILTALVSRQRDFSEVSSIDSSAFIQGIFTCTVFIVSINELIKNKTFRVLIIESPLKWFVSYILLGSLSALWSVNSSLTLYRAFENLSFLFLICASLSIVYNKYKSPEVLIYWVLYYAVLLIITGTLKRSLLWGLPLWSIDTLLMEQMNSSPFFFLVLLLPVGWFIRSIIISISIFSLSNTAYLGMIFGSLGLTKGKNIMKKILLLLILISILVIVNIGFEIILQNTVFYGKTGVGIEYTSGRNKIFEVSITEGLKKPLLGYGFVSGDTYVVNKFFEGAIGAHNGFLSAFLGMGIMGVIIFIGFFIKMLNISKSKFLPIKLKAPFLSSIILISIYTLGNPGLGSRVYGSWISSTIIMVLISLIYLHYKGKRRI